MSSVKKLPTPLNQFGVMAEVYMEQFLPKETSRLKEKHQWMSTLLQYQRRMEVLMERAMEQEIDAPDVLGESSFMYLLARHQVNRLQAEQQFYPLVLPPPEF